MTPLLYFAYGSNLDEGQFRSRCPAANREVHALLNGYTLVFGGHSRRWGGAVANVIPMAASAVPGFLYSLGEHDLARLDRFEGHPGSYERIVVAVIDAGGDERIAMAYVMPPGRCVPGEPSSEYLEVLRRAYVRLGFDDTVLARRR